MTNPPDHFGGRATSRKSTVAATVPLTGIGPLDSKIRTSGLGGPGVGASASGPALDVSEWVSSRRTPRIASRVPERSLHFIMSPESRGLAALTGEVGERES